MATVSVSIDSEIIGEMFLRAGPKIDVAGWIETIVSDYLERTADDQWSDAYYAYREQQASVEDFVSEYGDHQQFGICSGLYVGRYFMISPDKNKLGVSINLTQFLAHGHAENSLGFKFNYRSKN